MSRWLFLILIILSLGLVACGGDEDDNGDDNNESSTPLQADAGEDFMVMVGDTPTFDACDSEGGDIENFKWTILSAPESVTDDEGKVIREVETNCSFELTDVMVLEEVGDWEIELEISRGDETATDTVVVTVENDAATDDTGDATDADTTQTDTTETDETGAGTTDTADEGDAETTDGETESTQE